MCWWIHWDIHTRTLIYRLFPTASSTTVQQTCKSLCTELPVLKPVTQHTRTAHRVRSLHAKWTWSFTGRPEAAWMWHQAWRDPEWGLELESKVRTNCAWCVGTKLQDTTTTLWPVKAAKVISWFVLVGTERELDFWYIAVYLAGKYILYITDLNEKIFI